MGTGPQNGESPVCSGNTAKSQNGDMTPVLLMHHREVADSHHREVAEWGQAPRGLGASPRSA
jgi:hypothetical protein